MANDNTRDGVQNSEPNRARRGSVNARIGGGQTKNTHVVDLGIGKLSIPERIIKSISDHKKLRVTRTEYEKLLKNYKKILDEYCTVYGGVAVDLVRKFEQYFARLGLTPAIFKPDLYGTLFFRFQRLVGESGHTIERTSQIKSKLRTLFQQMIKITGQTGERSGDASTAKYMDPYFAFNQKIVQLPLLIPQLEKTSRQLLEQKDVEKRKSLIDDIKNNCITIQRLFFRNFDNYLNYKELEPDSVIDPSYFSNISKLVEATTQYFEYHKNNYNPSAKFSTEKANDAQSKMLGLIAAVFS